MSALTELGESSELGESRTSSRESDSASASTELGESAELEESRSGSASVSTKLG